MSESEDDGAFLARIAGLPDYPYILTAPNLQTVTSVGGPCHTVQGHDLRRLLALAGTHLPGGWSSWRDMAAEAVRQHQEAKQELHTAQQLARYWEVEEGRTKAAWDQAEADLAALRAEFVPTVRALARTWRWCCAGHLPESGEDISVDVVEPVLTSPLARAALKEGESDGE